jgi:exopolysaccharide production protein ExoZ
VPGWALNYFIFLYALFALFLFLPSARRRIAFVGLFLCLLVALQYALPNVNFFLDFYGAPIILDFALGMIVAWSYLSRARMTPARIIVTLVLSSMVFAAGFMHGVGSGLERLLFWGAPAAGLLLALVFIEKSTQWSNFSLVAQLGQASFAIYLSNHFTLAIITKFVQATGLFSMLGLGVILILYVVGALAVGLFASNAVERPLHRFIMRWSMKKKESPPFRPTNEAFRQSVDQDRLHLVHRGSGTQHA